MNNVVVGVPPSNHESKGNLNSGLSYLTVLHGCCLAKLLCQFFHPLLCSQKSFTLGGFTAEFGASLTAQQGT